MRSRGPIQAECKRAGCVPRHDVGDGVVAIVAIPPGAGGRRCRDGSDTNSQQIDLTAGRTLTESRHYSAFCGFWGNGPVFCPFSIHPKGFAEMDSRRLIRGAWIGAPISRGRRVRVALANRPLQGQRAHPQLIWRSGDTSADLDFVWQNAVLASTSICGHLGRLDG
jgi:hypothetical protein